MSIEKLKLDDIIRKIAWALIVGLVTYAVGEIKNISQSLNSLNTTVGILSEKLNMAGENSKEFKMRMEAMERLVFQLEKEIIYLKQKNIDKK